MAFILRAAFRVPHYYYICVLVYTKLDTQKKCTQDIVVMRLLVYTHLSIYWLCSIHLHTHTYNAIVFCNTSNNRIAVHLYMYCCAWMGSVSELPMCCCCTYNIARHGVCSEEVRILNIYFISCSKMRY